MHMQHAFAPDGRSVADARRFVRDVLGEWGVEDLVDEVVLAASELVTNAVVHAGTPVRIALHLEPDELRLEVQDLHPHRALPVGVEAPSEESEHGRGLFIAAALASSWGVDYTAGAKRVWVILDRSADAGSAGEDTPAPARTRRPAAPAATGVAVVELSPAGRVTAWNGDAVRLFGWAVEEVLDRDWHELADMPAAPSSEQWEMADWTTLRWQGTCAVRSREDRAVQVYARRLTGAAGDGSVVLLVPLEQRGLLDWAAPSSPATTDRDPLGLPRDSLSRLGLQAFLDLVVERARELFTARAAWLLVSRDFDNESEVAAVSGLDAGLRGTHLTSGDSGAPDPRNPRFPLVRPELAESDGGWLAAAGLRSVALAPIVLEGRVVGALGVGSERIAGFTDEQAVLLQRAAGAAASAADRARLRAAERERRGWLSFLAEAADLLAGSLDQDMTMAITGQIVVPRLATWCAVYLDDERRRAVLQQVWHRDERLVQKLRAALEQYGADRIAELPAEVAGAVHAVDLTARGRRIGRLVLGRDAGDPLRGESLGVLDSIARRAALAIDNARAHGELQAVGEALQRSLLPASIPRPGVFDVGVVYEAAGEAALAGGDFYDLFAVAGGRWCFAVGDVCGTGAVAAAVTGLARHTIRALALTGFPVASTMERLNGAILDEEERARFLTLVCGTLLPRNDGRLELSLVCAGHPPPFVVRRSGEVTQVGRPQSLLGVLDQVTYIADEAVLDRGDLLVVVTDGVLERREGRRMLEEQGVIDALGGLGDLSAQAVAERLRRLVADFAPTPQTDDLAVLVVKAGPAR